MTAPTKPQVVPKTTSERMLELMSDQNALLTQILERLQDLAAKPVAVPTNGHAPAQQPAPRPSAPTGPVQTFKASLLEGSVNAGKSYWKVKGGPFTKYGVTVWPEVLAMHTVFNNLPAGGMKTLDGWTAEYITKTNDKGDTVPDKVVRLIAPGFSGEEF